MVKIITIHGTNAGRPEDQGDQWWQKDSPFQKRLQELVEEPLEVEPFHWSGANSERQRRKAGERLAKLIRKQSEPPIVVGHSHGGSVAAHALFHLFLKDRKSFPDRLRALATVGTPMLRFRGSVNPLARFRPLLQLVALIVTSLLISHFMSPSRSDDVSLPLAAGTFVLAVFLYLVVRGEIRRASAFRANAVGNRMRAKYAPLNHAMDEAILGLSSLRKLKFGFMRVENLRGGVRAIIITAFAVAWFASHLTLILDSGSPFAKALSWVKTADSEFVPGLADHRNDLTVRLKLGESIPHPELMSHFIDQGYMQMLSQFKKHHGNPGLEFGKATSKHDYVVLDYATALSIRNAAEFLRYVQNLGPSARADFHCVRTDGVCTFRATALYLTPEGHRLLIEKATWLAAQFGEGAFRAGFVDAAPSNDSRAGLFSEASPGAAAPFRFVELNKTATPFVHVLALIGQTDLWRHSLMSPVSLPPDKMNVYAMRNYPALERGHEIVLPRNLGTSLFLHCAVGKAIGRPPVFNSLSIFLATATGAWELGAATGFGCEHFDFSSNGPFEIYRVATSSIALVIATQALWSNTGGEIAVALRGLFLVLPTFILTPFILWIFPLFVLELLLAGIAATVLRGIVGEQLRNTVYGNDGYGEKIAAIAPGIDFDQREVGTLPPDVETKIADHSLRHAENALRKVREVVSMAAANRTSPLLTDLSSSLTWQELIHTAYFDVPEFKEHFAKELARLAGLTLRADPPADRWTNASLASAAPLA